MYSYIYLHDLARLARQRSPLFLAAHYGQKPAGFIIGEAGHGSTGRAIHILKIVIDEKYRHKGIGSRLMQVFMDMAKESGFQACNIDVRMSNRNAISLYEKLEFQAKDVLPGFYPGGESCIKMEKCLARTS
jgi:ribosomal protein S18 acetylase RimI-like enzyme